MVDRARVQVSNWLKEATSAGYVTRQEAVSMVSDSHPCGGRQGKEEEKSSITSLCIHCTDSGGSAQCQARSLGAGPLRCPWVQNDAVTGGDSSS